MKPSNTDMLSAAFKLHKAGMALMWLRPRSKIPLGSAKDWTTKPKLTWKELKIMYRNGYNLGVRLGRVSKIEDGYLAVIDCDLKSEKPKHKAEMEAALTKLGIVDGPRVASGRGNGSCHLYILTCHPAKPQRLTQSSELVEVMMPSVKPSRRDEEKISKARLAEGYRLRAAWEIALMGEGQQVVLPPSIHPDSGQMYAWQTPFNSKLLSIGTWTPAPTMVTGAKSHPKSPAGSSGDFKPLDVYLLDRLPTKIVDLIQVGDGVEDRSASLMTAALSLAAHDFSDQEILSVLTDQDNYLGQVAYDHAQTKSRAKAASWLSRYTLAKARARTSREGMFRDAVSIDEIDPGEKPEPGVAVVGDGESTWEGKLVRAKSGVPLPSLINVCSIIKNTGGETVFRYNEFAETIVYGSGAPWGGVAGRTIQDQDLIEIKYYISSHFRMEPTTNLVLEAATKIASENRFHPVREYLNSLKWDCVERIDTWLKDYLGATGPEPYLSHVSRKVLCAMVARVFEPGIKFDQVLILQGDQGKGKSSALKILSDPWFSDTTLNIADKDSVLAMRTVWLMELGELSSMRKADAEALKEFISRAVDRIRMPYGKITQEFPRQCIFVGTTNKDDYLKDETGNRRFWPVNVKKLNRKGLRKVRDQLFAEAVYQYRVLGEELWLDKANAEAQAVIEQASRLTQDTWEETLFTFLDKRDEAKAFSLRDLFSSTGPLSEVLDHPQNQSRAAVCLKKLGYVQKRIRLKGGRQSRWWVKKRTPEKQIQVSR